MGSQVQRCSTDFTATQQTLPDVSSCFKYALFSRCYFKQNTTCSGSQWALMIGVPESHLHGLVVGYIEAPNTQHGNGLQSSRGQMNVVVEIPSSPGRKIYNVFLHVSLCICFFVWVYINGVVFQCGWLVPRGCFCFLGPISWATTCLVLGGMMKSKMGTWFSWHSSLDQGKGHTCGEGGLVSLLVSLSDSEDSILVSLAPKLMVCPDGIPPKS